MSTLFAACGEIPDEDGRNVYGRGKGPGKADASPALDASPAFDASPVPDTSPAPDTSSVPDTSPPPTNGNAWYVDQSAASSGDGTSPATAFKTIGEATTAASGGDTIFIAGGVYPETVNLSGLSGASSTARTRILGNSADPFIISGGETLVGLTPCTSADEATVGSNYASMYKTTVNAGVFPSSNPLAANLAEDGKQLTICMERADTSDDFFLALPTAYHTADVTITSGGLVQGFRKPSVTDNFTRTQIENARVHFVAAPNIHRETPVASFDTASNTIYLTDTSQTYEDSALKDNFALENLLPAMKAGEYGFVDHGDGTVTVYVWPNDRANVAAGRIEFSTRSTGIDFAGASHVEAAHFQVRQIAGTALNNGPIISRAGQCEDLYLHHFAVSNCLSAQSSYAMVHMMDVDDLHMHDFTLTRGRSYFGIFLQGSDASQADAGHPENVDQAARAYLHDFYINYTSFAPIRLYTQRDAVIAFGTIEDCSKATHGNTMNAYQGCYNTLFWGINGHNADGYVTWQESDSTVVAFCAASASRAVSGGARAIYSQQNSVPKPGSVYGWLGSYVLNTRGVPNGDGLSYANGLKAGSDAEPKDRWTVYNNIYHGHSAETFNQIDDWDYNINTSGSTVGPNDLSVASTSLYSDAAKEDFSYPVGSAVRSFKAKNWSSLIAGFQARWPHFDGWNKDMLGAAIDWSNPPIGPTVDLDADIGNRPLP